MADQLQDDLRGKLIIGIDLGTTKSGVAVYSEADGRPVMLRDENGDDTIPSIVAWDTETNDWVVGKPAKAVLETRPWDVAYSVKRFIGRAFSDRAVAESRSSVTYALAGGDGIELTRDVKVLFGEANNVHHTLDIPEISAKILAHLRKTAARALNLPLEDVKHAVITIPAYFDMRQRQATRLAGKLAGLDVRGILHEPTAAALSHSDDILSEETRTILVYDLGGGTFDISLLDVKRDAGGYEFFTRLIDGDTRLGGDDIDSAISRQIEERIREFSGENIQQDDALTRSRLRLAAERAKRELTVADSTSFTLDALDLGSRGEFDIPIRITRKEMEMCAMPTIKRARDITERAVRKVSGMDWSEIHEVVLVGGQTQMPAIQKDIAELTGKKPRVSDRPQTAIALGAAQFAHILSLGREEFEQHALVGGIGLALGIRLHDGSFHKLVDANVNVPHQSKETPIMTTKNNQTEIIVEILQGKQEERLAENCTSLGEIRMEVLPAPAGQNRYTVRFEVAADGTLKATVTDPQLKRSEPQVIGDSGIVVYREQKNA